MKEKNFFPLIVLTTLSMVLFLLIFSNVSYSETKPFTLEQVLELLKKGIKQSEIISQVEKYKVNFESTTENVIKLVRADTNDDLLDAIKKNHSEENLVIIFPANNERCGAIVRVDGRSKKYPNKFLWVFAHRSDLTDKWWPQTGLVKVQDDGEWVIGVNLGIPDDVGFDFEIKAIWVDQSVNTEMASYLERGANYNHYPSIELPQGSPSAQVTVTKVKH